MSEVGTNLGNVSNNYPAQYQRKTNQLSSNPATDPLMFAAQQPANDVYGYSNADYSKVGHDEKESKAGLIIGGIVTATAAILGRKHIGSAFKKLAEKFGDDATKKAGTITDEATEHIKITNTVISPTVNLSAKDQLLKEAENLGLTGNQQKEFAKHLDDLEKKGINVDDLSPAELKVLVASIKNQPAVKVTAATGNTSATIHNRSGIQSLDDTMVREAKRVGLTDLSKQFEFGKYMDELDDAGIEMAKIPNAKKELAGFIQKGENGKAQKYVQWLKDTNEKDIENFELLAGKGTNLKRQAAPVKAGHVLTEYAQRVADARVLLKEGKITPAQFVAIQGKAITDSQNARKAVAPAGNTGTGKTAPAVGTTLTPEKRMLNNMNSVKKELMDAKNTKNPSTEQLDEIAKLKEKYNSYKREHEELMRNAIYNDMK